MSKRQSSNGSDAQSRLREQRTEKIKDLIKLAEDQGFLTFDDINKAIPDSVVSAEDLESYLVLLRGMDIEIIESSDVLKYSASRDEERRQRCSIRDVPTGSWHSYFDVLPWREDARLVLNFMVSTVNQEPPCGVVPLVSSSRLLYALLSVPDTPAFKVLSSLTNRRGAATLSCLRKAQTERTSARHSLSRQLTWILDACWGRDESPDSAALLRALLHEAAGLSLGGDVSLDSVMDAYDELLIPFTDFKSEHLRTSAGVALGDVGITSRDVMPLLERLDSTQDIGFLDFGQLLILPMGKTLRVLPLDDYGLHCMDACVTERERWRLSFIDTSQFLTPEDTDELEWLINKRNVQELELQRFFESHPAFLWGSDYVAALPHVALSLPESKSLVPDFFLKRADTHLWDILDVKLPSATPVTGPPHRRQFSKTLKDAIAQLREYRDYFDDSENRRTFERQFGMRAYKPRTSVLIGRASHFTDVYERRKIELDAPCNILTYDDILRVVRNRMFLPR